MCSSQISASEVGWEKTSNLPRAHWGPRAMPGKHRDSNSILTPCPPTRPLVGRGHRSQQLAIISMPPPQAAGCMMEWRSLNKVELNMTVPEYSQAAFGRSEGEKLLFFFFSPPHPGHGVSQGSGNRGDGPAPPIPQARPRRVRKAQDRLPTSSWRRRWLSHRVERGSSLSGLTLTQDPSEK